MTAKPSTSSPKSTKTPKTIWSLRNRSVAALALAATLLLAANFAGEALSIRQEQEQLDRLQAEVQALEQRRDNLRALVEEAGRPEYVEQIARDQLTMRFPADQVWVPFPLGGEGAASNPPAPAIASVLPSAQPRLSWWDVLFR
ncbi:MAG: septum formation initiator family protein [Chloroflexi bacterium]|nr:septum formation initiator family protein [Chloroflexota bacterium]